MMQRLIGSAGAAALTAAHRASAQGNQTFAEVVPNYAVTLPQDHGSHPQFRTEWWYITAMVKTASGNALGLQITFFRTATGAMQDNPSRFAAKHLMFAHLAVADPASKTLYHDQQAARAGTNSFFTSEQDTHCRMRHWYLQRQTDDSYVAKASSIYLPSNQAIAIDLRFTPKGPALLQGNLGFSRKGPNPQQASYYYSRPQMKVTGSVTLQQRNLAVTGQAWLDHEWSTSLLDDRAIGWDWIGINLNDGGSLMAFQLRDKVQSVVPVWSYVVLRNAQGEVIYAANQIDAAQFSPKRFWKSPQSNATYPTSQTLRCGPYEWMIEPLFDQQEIDARASTGGYYWEGVIRLLDQKNATPVGQGYLEMTGYAAPIKLKV